MIVGCRCAWQGDILMLTDKTCPKCGAGFEEAPPLRLVPWKKLTPAIAHELYKALERLGADLELLSVIGSYGDTLSDEEVLRLLRDWNATGKVIQKPVSPDLRRTPLHPGRKPS